MTPKSRPFLTLLKLAKVTVGDESHILLVLFHIKSKKKKNFKKYRKISQYEKTLLKIGGIPHNQKNPNF